MNIKKIMAVQIIFIVLVLTVLYISYPRASAKINGNAVKFYGASAIEISNNPDFSNSKYMEINNESAVNLPAGIYYWRASNRVISGFGKKLTVNSEVGMKIERDGDDSEIVNVGNVKINVTKTGEGVLMGYVVLEPNESDKIEDKDERYTGRQNE